MQEPEVNSLNTKALTRLATTSCLILALLGAQPLHAETADDTADAGQATTSQRNVIGQRYIRDYIYVPLRSGQSEAHRIVHRGIRSGTMVSLLEQNDESGYSLVRLGNGLEGWMGSQYLQQEPTAEKRLEEAQHTISRLSSTAGSAGEQLLALESQNRELDQSLRQLQSAHDKLQQDFDHLNAISGNAQTLHDDNNRLMKENEAMKSRQDTLQVENARLTHELKRNDFLDGAIAVILGIIATLVIQYFYRSRKRTDWA